MTEAQLAFKVGSLFDRKISSAFWSSFDSKYGKTQIEVLVYLHDNEPAKASEISSSLNVPKQHVSKIIKAFSNEGLVSVIPDNDDKRANLIKLSDAGRALIEDHIKISNKHFEDLLNGLDPQSRATMLNSLKDLADILESV